jgi:hypothetical protein
MTNSLADAQPTFSDPAVKRAIEKAEAEGWSRQVAFDMIDNSLVDGIEDYARLHGICALQDRVAEILLGLKRKY